MNKNNIKCPRCHSKKLYKFGFDKQSNQKYQCKECGKQFAPDYVGSGCKSKYPRCPKCNRATYIHHKYKHYNQYRCGNKKCNHAFSQYHNLNINLASSETLTGSLSMKGMRFPLHTILTALTLYFLNNTSTKAIAQFLKITSNISVSHATIYNWVHKFAPYFKKKAKIFNSQLDLNSDDWHADETVVFINGKKYYLWLAIDSETRFIVAFHLTQSRDSYAAFALMNKAKYTGKPKNFITDRIPSYHEAVKTVLNESTHIPVSPMSSDTNNNLIESFNKTFKAWYKAKKCFNSFEKANNLIYMFIFHYNFIRPHGSLNGSTPTEVAGFNANDSNKHNWFIAA